MKRSIPRGVSIRLAGITTRTDENQKESLSSLYPDVHDTMIKSGILKGEAALPKLGKILDSRMEEQIASEMRKEERKKDKRNVYLMSRYSGNWRIPLHKTAKKLRDKHDLKWLRVRMIHKRHQNLKEMLLGDIATKVTSGIVEAGYAKKTKKKLCNCRSSCKVDGECLYGENCELKCVIYKITCKCCRDFYIGKTQRELKSRCQEHYHDTGEFLKKKLKLIKELNERLTPQVESSVELSSGRTRCTSQQSHGLSLPSRAAESGNRNTHTPSVRHPSSLGRTRSQSRAMTAELQTPATAQPTPATGMEHIQAFISLYEQNAGLTQLRHPPPVIYEDGQLEAREIESHSSPVSSTRPTNLTNNPQFKTTDQPSTTSSLSGSEDRNDSQPSQNSNASPSHSTSRQFREAFGLEEHEIREINQLEETARRVETYLRPMLEPEYAKVAKVSQLSRHMWSHAKHIEFASRKELYGWIRSNWEIEVLDRTSQINHMKTAGTKNCQLCMKERVELFHEFSKKKSPTHNLMNSKSELYGQCSCKTRFLRLQAVGNAGADEATS
jgi:cell pole-organizing protein PopZ